MKDIYHFKYGFFNHDLKLIWFRIPKVGSTTLADTLHTINFFKDCKYDNNLKVRVNPTDIMENITLRNYNKFCFVRNPWDRLVASYYNRIIQSKRIGNEFNDIKDLTFENILYRVCELKDDEVDEHFRSQSSYITYKDKLITTDIGKLETLQTDWGNITNKYNLKATTLKHLKKGGRPNKNKYQHYYNTETKKLVEKRFNKDIELFKYKF